MKVTFLSHSGFLVELKRAALLFDYIGGDLPPVGGKPLLVFASHRHADHFIPGIFDLPASHFILSRDIPGFTGENITLVGPDEMHAPLPGVLVETLPSTDEGVAYLVTAGAETIFHAGDLNWWHWEGEDKAWNNAMAASFRRYCEPLRHREIDLAMLPLDPRLGEDGFRGPKHFLNLADIRRFLPMHQWGDFGFTEKFLAQYPEFAAQTVPVSREGQSFIFKEDTL